RVLTTTTPKITHAARPVFFLTSRRRHTRFSRDWSSDVCSSDLPSPPSATHGDNRPDQGPVPMPVPRTRSATTESTCHGCAPDDDVPSRQVRTLCQNGRTHNKEVPHEPLRRPRGRRLGGGSPG